MCDSDFILVTNSGLFFLTSLDPQGSFSGHSVGTQRPPRVMSDLRSSEEWQSWQSYTW